MPTSATGLTARIFAQSRRELGAPFAPHLAAAPDLHAATWALLRESLLAGSAPRVRKEAAALAVAVANQCPFCVDAHGALLHATGAHGLARTVLRGETPRDPEDAAIVAWARAGRATTGPPPVPPPQRAEFIGTVLVNHFINRMVDALRPGALLPVSSLRRLAGAALARRVRRPVPAGESLRFLGPVTPGDVPAWAPDTPIGTAYAAFRQAARVGGDLLDTPDREQLTSAVAEWMWSGGLALPPVPPSVRPALLAAVAPYRITEPDASPGFVRLLAFGAFTAVERIEAGVTHVAHGR